MCEKGVVEGSQVFFDTSLLVLAIPEPKTPANENEERSFSYKFGKALSAFKHISQIEFFLLEMFHFV